MVAANEDFQYAGNGSVLVKELRPAERDICVDVVLIRDGIYENNETFVTRTSIIWREFKLLLSTIDVIIQDSDSKWPIVTILSSTQGLLCVFLICTTKFTLNSCL